MRSAVRTADARVASAQRYATRIAAGNARTNATNATDETGWFPSVDIARLSDARAFGIDDEVDG
jgi:hypothetical protein